LGLPAGNDIVEFARLELGDVVIVGHATVEHHGGALLEADALAQAVEHGGKRSAILGIASEDLMGDRKAVAIDDEADHDLLAIRSVIARIAARRLAVLGGKALEISRGEIVEIDRGDRKS